jgi:hypothetical protein
VKTTSHWTVTKQSPKAGAHANTGGKITLTVIKTTAYIAKQTRSFYSQNYGSFHTTTHRGSGLEILAVPHGAKAAMAVATFDGAGAFTIVELGAGEVPTGRTLVSAARHYSGANALGLTSQKVSTTEIEINGRGKWSVTIEPVSKAPIVSVPITAMGDHVYLYSGPTAMWTVSSPGPTTFILNQISSSSYPNLAVNESGSWAGPIALQPGPSVIEIHSNGGWTIH